MLKKLFVTAAAAAAMSVPLAGVAWATPSDNNPPGQGATGPGVPHELGGYLASPDPVPPGELFNSAKDFYEVLHPGQKAPNTPVAFGEFVDAFYGNTTFGPTPPGLGTKTFTPGCGSGHVAVGGGNLPVPDCH